MFLVPWLYPRGTSGNSIPALQLASTRSRAEAGRRAGAYLILLELDYLRHENYIPRIFGSLLVWVGHNDLVESLMLLFFFSLSLSLILGEIDILFGLPSVLN